MSSATIRPGRVAGTVDVPASKSITHRAYLLAAQSATPCVVQRPLRAADTDATLACLHRLGHHLEPGAPDAPAVGFRPAPARPPAEPLDCRNSGTTLRLLTGTAARHPFPVHFIGDDSLSTRPNLPLHDALRGLGATIDAGPQGQAPLTVRGPIQAGATSLPPRTSSQYASSLLLSLALATGDSTLHMTGPVASAPYLDITRSVAAGFGIGWDQSGDAATGITFHIPGGQTPRATSFRVEADWSTAAFPLVAGAITGGPVTVRGANADSVQGDRVILDVLARFGATIVQSDEGLRVEADGLGSPGTVDVAATPDMFPALCVLAAAAEGTTTITGGESLRHKESDRIAAMVDGLQALGADITPTPDGAVILGGQPLHGADVAALHDHRIHMALCLAGLIADGNTVVDSAESAAVSYPGFHDDLRRLQAGAHEVQA